MISFFLNLFINRLPLTTKRVGKGYYKGNGCRREGYLTSKGGFKVVSDWRTELIVPDLSNFKLKPYIAYGAKRNIIDPVVILNKAI